MKNGGDGLRTNNEYVISRILSGVCESAVFILKTSEDANILDLSTDDNGAYSMHSLPSQIIRIKMHGKRNYLIKCLKKMMISHPQRNNILCTSSIATKMLQQEAF